MFKSYRKRPLEILALCWSPGTVVEGLTECYDASGDITYGTIQTLEGKMIVNPGDWVILGVEGELYCCKDSVFKKSYDEVKHE